MNEREQRPRPIWENRMTPLQCTLGRIYLPMHALVLPALVLLYADVGGRQVNTAYVNLAYYVLGVIVVLAVFLPYLRVEFDVLLDRLLLCLRTALLGYFILYALDGAASLLMQLAPLPDDPNNEKTLEMIASNFGIVKGVSVFLAPIVEEVLFRGVLFGSLRTRSRGRAYVISTAVFCVYHVWQAVVTGGDWRLLIYALQYVPISVVLAWCYERSGSLWTGIFYHMGYNALSFAALEQFL